MTNSKTIAITGGSGFIGSNLAVLLTRNNQKFSILDIIPSRQYPNQYLNTDITSPHDTHDALKNTSAIIHLAAEHRDDVFPRNRYYDVNVGGAENIVHAAETHDIKTIIFTSTVAVYGLNKGISSESDTPDPFNDYGKSKLDSETVFKEWANAAPDRRLVIIRLVATFGKGNRGNIYTLMDQIHRRRFVMVGTGKNKKSIAYVGNVASFLAHTLQNGAPGIHTYNYADKPDLSTYDLVSDIRNNFDVPGIGPRIPYLAGMAGGAGFDLLAKITGKQFPISTVRVQKFCANTLINADKLKETGFIRPYSLQDGLQEMIRAEFLTDQNANTHNTENNNNIAA